MIIYFSATGNSEFVADKIADVTNDTAFSITEIKNKIVLKDGEQLGIVTPTYFWGLPSYVNEFMGNIQIENADNSYIYYIATYGTTAGQADYYIKKHLKNKGLTLNASYGIKTVDNWTVWFDVNDKNKIQEISDEEDKQINQIIEPVIGQKRVFISKDKKPLWLCAFAQVFYKSARKTSHLKVSDDCIGCAICESLCPVQAIKIIDNKPQWITDRCSMCFKCLHNCPEFAINYDNKTQKHGQYKHYKYKKGCKKAL